MATKADFSEAEWQVLRWAVSDTMAYLSMADPGLWDTFKEAGAAAKYMAGIKVAGDNALMRELAGDTNMKRDKEVAGNPADIAGEVVERVTEAAELVANKAPEDLEAFKALVIGVAKATAAAAKGTGPAEVAAIERLEKTLG
jgi:hypothetical protein